MQVALQLNPSHALSPLPPSQIESDMHRYRDLIMSMHDRRTSAAALPGKLKGLLKFDRDRCRLEKESDRGVISDQRLAALLLCCLLFGLAHVLREQLEVPGPVECEESFHLAAWQAAVCDGRHRRSVFGVCA